jgi:hypothetical protein
MSSPSDELTDILCPFHFPQEESKDAIGPGKTAILCLR